MLLFMLHFLQTPETFPEPEKMQNWEVGGVWFTCYHLFPLMPCPAEALPLMLRPLLFITHAFSCLISSCLYCGRDPVDFLLAEALWNPYFSCAIKDSYLLWNERKDKSKICCYCCCHEHLSNTAPSYRVMVYITPLTGLPGTGMESWWVWKDRTAPSKFRCSERQFFVQDVIMAWIISLAISVHSFYCIEVNDPSNNYVNMALGDLCF